MPPKPKAKPQPKSKPQPQVQNAFDELFGAQQGEQDASGFKLIEHHLIATAPQPRLSFPPREIEELARSIQALRAQGGGIEATGLLQPLIVRPLKAPTSQGERYILVAGERRFRATRLIGLPRVPALVVPMDQSGVLLAQMIENLQRQGLPPLDEARSLCALMEEQSLSIREAANVLGKTRGYLTNRLDLLKMGQDVQDMVSSREDTLKHASLIHGVPDPDLRQQLIHAVLGEGASVKEIERRLQPAPSNSISSNASDDRDRTSVSSREDSSQDTLSGDPKAVALSSREDTSQDTSPGDLKAVALSSREDRADNPETTLLSSREDSKVNNGADPVGDLLRPAAEMAEEASRLLAASPLTPASKKQVRALLRALEGTVDGIKRLLR